MRVLVACEFSGRVREAFKARGHDAWSCDLEDTEIPGKHIKADVRSVLGEEWDLMIAHPPCTHLAVSGARWFKEKQQQQEEALLFVKQLMYATWIPRKCIENPISVISSRIRKPDQIIHPYHFGHPEFKATCLWLSGLPKLVPTSVLAPPAKGSPEWKAWNKVHREPPGKNRHANRSRTYQGIADAMAEQWGRL